MRLKYTILLCTVFLIPIAVVAQSSLFSHSIGGGVFSTRGFLGVSAVYTPRVNFLQFSQRSVIALETSIAPGLHIGDNYNNNMGGNSTSIFMLNVPVLLSWNYGNAATNKAHDKAGFFAGIGWGFHNSSYIVKHSEPEEEEEATPGQLHISGLALSTGVRWQLYRRSIGLKVCWLFNNNQFNTDITGIGGLSIHYNIGDISH